MSSDDEVTEAFIREVIAMFRRYGRVEVRTKVDGNLVRMVLGKSKQAGQPGGDRPDRRGASSDPIPIRPAALARSARRPEDIPNEEIEAAILGAPDESGIKEEELCRVLGLAGGRAPLLRALQRLRDQGRVKGPARSGRVRLIPPRPASRQHRP